MKKRVFVFLAFAVVLTVFGNTAIWAQEVPTTAVGFYDRGKEYFWNDDFDRAIADFSRALSMEPNAPAFVWSARGLAYYIKGDFDRAIADFTQSIKLDPNVGLVYNDRGLAYEDKGDLDRALADYTQAIQLDPNGDAAPYFNRGCMYSQKMNDNDRAIADFTQAIRIDPNHSMAYHLRGIAYYNKKDYDRAIADFEALLRFDPKDITREWLDAAQQARGR